MSIDHNKNIIEVTDLSFSFGDHPVLKNISLNIHQGDYLGIIGPNGGGKTTLIKLILGLLPKQEGIIKLFDTPIQDFHDWTNIAYVAQKVTNIDNTFPLTVTEIVAMGRYSQQGILGNSSINDKEKVAWALDQVELTSLRNTLIGNLSGGQQQRVFIARALCQEPKIIFLDEPTSGIDAHSQEKFYLLLEKLNLQMNITLVLISHDIDVIAQKVTEVACINQSLVYHGNPEKFINDDYLKKLYGTGMKFIRHDHSI